VTNPGRDRIKSAINDLWATPVGKVAYVNLTLNVFLILMLGRSSLKTPALTISLMVFIPFILTRFREFLVACARPSSFLALFVFFCCSFAWSLTPSLTADRIITQIGFITLGYLVATRYSSEAFFKSLRDSVYVCILFAVVYCLIFPGASYTTQGLKSFYVHKNYLGLAMALNAIVLLSSHGGTKFQRAMGIVAIILMLGSLSKTSIILTFVCLTAPFIVDRVRLFLPRKENVTHLFDFSRVFVYWVIVAVICSIVIFRDAFVDFVWLSIDKDLFTGRGVLWLTVIQQIREHSLLGIGPGALWQAGGKSEIARTTLYQLDTKWIQNMVSSDGSYIDLLAAIGTAGVALFLLTVVDFYRMIFRNWGIDYVRLMFSLVTFVLLHGITESTVFYSPNILWFIFVCCYARVFLIHSTNLSPTPWQRLWGAK
jgi:O-antigen ligase